MVALSNTFEGGTDGGVLTVANSAGANNASGTAFSHVVSNNVSVGTAGSANITTQTAIVGRGAFACKMVVTAGSSYLRLPVAATGRGIIGRRMIYLESVPSANFTVIAPYASSTLLGSAQVTSAMKVQAYRGSTSLAAAGLSTTVLAEDKVYWLDFGVLCESAASAADGVVGWWLYDSDGSTLLESKAVTGLGTGTSVGDAVRFGGHTTASGMVNDYIDDVRVDSRTTSLSPIGAMPNVPPTVTGPAPQTVAAGAAAAVDFIASDQDGTIASRSTTIIYPTTNPPAITGGGTGAVRFTAPAAPALVILEHTATDNSGAPASTPARAEVRVPAGGTVAPIAANGAGGWSRTGATTDGEALANVSDTDYVASPTLTSTENEGRWRLNPSVTRNTGQMTPRLRCVDATSANVKARLYEGNTLRQEWSVTINGSWTSYPCVLDAGTVSAITDWGNLYGAIAAAV